MANNRLVSFISTLAISGLVLGVGLLVVVLSVMNGFDRELRERILAVVPHVQIIHNSGVENWQQQAAAIAAQPAVSEVSPYNEVNGLINFRRDSRPVQLLGLTPEALPAGIATVFKEAGVELPPAGQLLLSEVIASNLNISLGQRVTIIIPAAAGPTKAVSLKVAGLFSTHTEVDQLLAIANLEQVAEIANLPAAQVKGFRVQIEDQFNARQQGYQLLEQLPYGYGFRDWFQTHGNLYQAIQLSRNMVGLLIFMIIAIAAFNVISMLMMSVIDKRRGYCDSANSGALASGYSASVFDSGGFYWSVWYCYWGRAGCAGFYLGGGSGRLYGVAIGFELFKYRGLSDRLYSRGFALV